MLVQVVKKTSRGQKDRQLRVELPVWSHEGRSQDEGPRLRAFVATMIDLLTKEGLIIDTSWPFPGLTDMAAVKYVGPISLERQKSGEGFPISVQEFLAGAPLKEKSENHL